jgi:predicted P-loop ATPase
LYVTCWNIIELLKNPFTYTDRNLGTSILDITRTFIYNELTHEVEFREVPPWKTLRNEWAKRITDFDMVQVKTLLTPFFDKEVPIVVLDEALFGVQSVQQFHPVREILKGLKWDGIPRLDNWLIDYCGVESNAYTKAAGAKTLISLIARVMEPGVKKDEMLLLEGEQGIGKTRLCELLGLDRYFHSCSLDRLDKDFLQNLEGKILIEVSELAGFKNSDMEKVKAMLTRRVDTYRKSYGRKSGDYPRQYIFIGTINPSKDGRYLRDETGNRRFWPVRCEYIKYDEIHEARNQLFAEAIVRWNNGKGETLYLDNVYAQEIHRMGAAERQTCTTTLRNLQEYYEGNLGAEWPVIWHGDVIYDALNMKTSKTTSRALQEINDFFKINRYIRTRRRDATGREKTAYVFMENEDGSDL